MEIPYNGRAIIQDNVTDLQITIPTKKNWFIILFGVAWLSMWLLGEVFVTWNVGQAFARNPAGFFVVFWLVGWTVAGFVVFRYRGNDPF